MQYIYKQSLCNHSASATPSPSHTLPQQPSSPRPACSAEIYSTLSAACAVCIVICTSTVNVPSTDDAGAAHSAVAFQRLQVLLNLAQLARNLLVLTVARPRHLRLNFL